MYKHKGFLSILQFHNARILYHCKKNKMRKLLVFSLFLFVVSFLQVKAQELKPLLEKLQGVEVLEKAAVDGYSESYILKVKMPIDHNDESKGYFTQRVFITHRSFDAPTVLVTEGYSAEHAKYSWYIEELTTMLNANQIVIEHRFFGKSIPDNCPWEYLNVRQAAADHHLIISMLKPLYKGKWVSTGASKGGSTCVYHRALYPNDVEATVSYVAPFTVADEDPRCITFLKNVGEDSIRTRIHAFQRAVLKNREDMKKYIAIDMKTADDTLIMSIDSTLDYMVVEYPFAFFQYCGNTASIPSPDAKPTTLYKHLKKIIAPTTYGIHDQQGTGAFFVQAYNEVGYYGYDTTGLGDLLSIKSGYISNRILVPRDAPVQYNPEMLEMVRNYIKTDAKNIIFIYGEDDPWSATAAVCGDNQNVVFAMDKDNCHNVRIADMPDDLHMKIISMLEEWLSVDIK